MSRALSLPRGISTTEKWKKTHEEIVGRCRRWRWRWRWRRRTVVQLIWWKTKNTHNIYLKWKESELQAYIHTNILHTRWKMINEKCNHLTRIVERRTPTQTHTHTHTFMHIYTYLVHISYIYFCFFFFFVICSFFAFIYLFVIYLHAHKHAYMYWIT